ncbi:MAG TPA: hypothetical protein VIH90_07745, partial [Candidatus Saccharimonadales bacterium]
QISKGINIGRTLVHGTATAYNGHRCRCAVCKLGHRDRRREERNGCKTIILSEAIEFANWLDERKVPIRLLDNGTVHVDTTRVRLRSDELSSISNRLQRLRPGLVEIAQYRNKKTILAP